MAAALKLVLKAQGLSCLVTEPVPPKPSCLVKVTFSPLSKDAKRILDVKCLPVDGYEFKQRCSCDNCRLSRSTALPAGGR